MSSPIARKQKSLLNRSVIDIHQKVSHGNRVRLLSEALGEVIQGVSGRESRVKCLDIGCGDMTIAKNLARINRGTEWNCIDIHELPEQFRDQARWARYRQFDGRRIPFKDKTFRVALFCDVLHHIPPSDMGTLLCEAARVAEVVVIKDHFESGIYSRTMLRLMDAVGNWGYGVSIPRRYFTRNSLALITRAAGLDEIRRKEGVELYGHLPLVRSILRREWQFISLFTARSSQDRPRLR